MTSKRITIRGRVQGVGYRDWLIGRAKELGLAGWVRNRSDGAVEALICGDTAAVEELLRACRLGPRLAVVAAIEEEWAEPAEDPGFRRLPTL